MSSFFDSEVVRMEMTDIQELQEEVYGSVFNFPQMNQEEKIEHIDLLLELLEKQRILYTRMSLSDDPQAKKMKQNIQESAVMMGMPKDVDMATVFANMEKMIELMQQQVDNSSV
jgi:protocatechuate 3,4-dioxygenase beta subunit